MFNADCHHHHINHHTPLAMVLLISNQPVSGCSSLSNRMGIVQFESNLEASHVPTTTTTTTTATTSTVVMTATVKSNYDTVNNYSYYYSYYFCYYLLLLLLGLYWRQFSCAWEWICSICHVYLNGGSWIVLNIQTTCYVLRRVAYDIRLFRWQTNISAAKALISLSTTSL